ncbi:MAG: universal stress protein [Verrucomicrobiota bacterium]
MMRILFGTDFSENAARAGDVAAAMAERVGDILLVVHASPHPRSTFTTSETKLLAAGAALRSEGERLRAQGAVVKLALLNGSPGETLVHKAESAGARLVVLASQSKKARARWWFGSVSEWVAEHCTVPTLIVREEHSLLAWLRAQRPLRVLCAFDFSSPAEAALHYARKLQRLGPCDIVVIQVDRPVWERIGFGRAGARPLGFNFSQLQALLERNLRKKTDEIFEHSMVRIRVEPGWGRPDARLIEIARAEKSDLVITGSHQWQGLSRLRFGSTSRSLLRFGGLNVLVVPSPMETVAPVIPKIGRVMVTTDFSPAGDAAIVHAYSIVQPGGTVYLLHVMPPFDFPNPLIAGHFEPRQTRRGHAQSLRAAAEKLQSLIPATASSCGAVSKCEVVQHRNPAVAIAQTAERLGADVICMASHGRSGLGAAVLGSVTQEVLTRSHRPVYVVRHAE